jgi:hypothetical protein
MFGNSSALKLSLEVVLDTVKMVPRRPKTPTPKTLLRKVSTTNYTWGVRVSYVSVRWTNKVNNEQIDKPR